LPHGICARTGRALIEAPFGAWNNHFPSDSSQIGGSMYLDK
jgi:hypothetical protein